MQHVGAAGAVNIAIQIRTAVLGAVAQIDAAHKLESASSAAANTIIHSTNALRDSVDALTTASNQNTDVMSRWAKATARWTMWLTVATVALCLATIVQLAVLLLRAR